MTNHRYAYLGPLPGSPWDQPDTIARLRAVTTILAELHDAAGRPTARRIALCAGTTASTVSYLLSGRRLPTWDLTRRIGMALVSAANREWPPVKQQLRDAYIKTYDQGNGS